MKQLLKWLILGMFIPTLGVAQRSHTVPEISWQHGYVQEADTTTDSRLDNTNDPKKYWRIYDGQIHATNWFRLSEYMTWYYWIGDTITSQDNDINFRFKTGCKVYNKKTRSWAIEDNTVNIEFTINVTSVGSGVIKITGDHTIGTGPWGCMEIYGTSAGANDSTIVINNYDGYDVKRY